MQQCRESKIWLELTDRSKIVKTLSTSFGVFLDKPTVLKKVFGLKESFTVKVKSQMKLDLDLSGENDVGYSEV